MNSINFPSRTAAVHFKMRGLHSEIDQGEIIFDDPIAKLHHSKFSFDHDFTSLFWKSLRVNGLFRSKISEHYLRESINNGTKQYVILGAGLDTFSARNMPWAKELKVFQIDHIDVISARKNIIGSYGIDIGCNIQDLTISRLVEDGFNPEEPAFFSMLGVSMYLDIPTQFKIYSEIASLKKVDFVMTHLGTQVSPNMNIITQSVERSGEPFIGKIENHKLIAMLESVGFTSITKPSSSFISDWYSRSSLPKPNLRSITISKK